MKQYLMLLILILASGCTAVSVDDGVPRNENGTPLTTYHKTGLTVSEHEVQRVYEGEAYIASVTEELSSGEVYDIIGYTDGRRVAMDFREITVDDLGNQPLDVGVLLYEDATAIVNGTPVTEFNLNRNVPEDNTFMIYENGTANVTNALLIDPLSNTLITDEKKIIASNRGDNMYIMKENSTYALRVVNNGAGDVNILFRWIWHEDDKVTQ